jgi:hypothetical protein
MRKLAIFIVLGILVLSGLGASALNITKENTNMDNIKEVTNKNTRGTHTVLGEFGTSTTCGYCRYAHGALKELFAEGELDFYYVSLVCNKNAKAYSRAINDYNVYGYPTLWWDGGHRVNIGANNIPSAKTYYTSSINYCGSSSVKNIQINLDTKWLGGTRLKVECDVINNEASTYNGHVRVYIVEKESSMGWKDAAGNLYTMAFLDWAFNEPLSISSGSSWSDSMTWNGLTSGFPSVTRQNTFIIAAVFNDEWHQGYSYPPNNPFDAYYVDDVVGEVVGTNNINIEITKNKATDILPLKLLQSYPNLMVIIQKINQLIN